MDSLISFINSKQFAQLGIALFCLILFIFLCRKYKLNKYQILVFILFCLFWSSAVVFRSYRKTYALTATEFGGLGLGELAAVSITSIYGFISIFIRLPIFIITDFFKSRKFFIGLSLVAIFITSLLVYLYPSQTTLFCSSLAIGIAASFISLFNVMFADTFDTKNAILSVSILSIAPLLAEFLMSPIQYLATMDTVKNYGVMWLISSILVLIALVLLLFVKDNKEKVVNFTLAKVKTVITNKTFLLLCLLGVFVSFIKFATSDANFVAFANLEEINMGAFGVAYADVVFSAAQLIAGVFAGIYLKKKIGIKNTLLLGVGSSFLFSVLPLITTNSIILFWANSLNGFGYGITYNILIGLVMQPFSKDYREITMGIYQTFFAIGIYYGDRIYRYIYKLFSNESLYVSYKNVYLVISVITLCPFTFIALYFRKKNKEFIEA